MGMRPEPRGACIFYYMLTSAFYNNPSVLGQHTINHEFIQYARSSLISSTMDIGSHAFRDCANGKDLATRCSTPADNYSGRSYVVTGDSEAAILKHDKADTCAPSPDFRRPKLLGEQSVQEEASAKAKEIGSQATETESQHAPVPQALDLHSTLLKTLRHRGFRQGRASLKSPENGSVDRSPQSFAAALEHLESRMGRI